MLFIHFIFVLFLINLKFNKVSTLTSVFSPQTTSGTLQGVCMANRFGTACAYLGVRYGSIPERFALPTSYKIRDPTRAIQANQLPIACQQPPHLTQFMYPQLTLREGEDKPMSEECLFLNVFMPQEIADSRAILVWLPGEGFDFADAGQFDAGPLAVLGDIVVITVGYRVGVFGFLSSGNSSLPGNQAAWDVLEALRWIRLNAASFHADPEKITLAGRFSGAMLVSMLLASPKLVQKNPYQGKEVGPLIRRVILQSGIAAGNYVFESDPASQLNQLAEMAKCPLGNFEKTLTCLRTLSVSELTQFANKIAGGWRPVVEGRPEGILPMEPIRAFRRKENGAPDRRIDIMIGDTPGEGVLCLMQHYVLETTYAARIADDNLTQYEFDQLIGEHVHDLIKSPDVAISTSVIHEYRPWQTSYQPKQLSLRDELLHMCGRAYIRVPLEQATRALSKRGHRVWRYEWNHRGVEAPHDPRFGPVHGDEIPFVFALIGHDKNVKLNEIDYTIMLQAVSTWRNFIKSGNPNPNSSDNKPWPIFDLTNKWMFIFRKNNENATNIGSTDFLSKDLHFWTSVIPRLTRRSKHLVSFASLQDQMERLSIVSSSLAGGCWNDGCSAFTALVVHCVLLSFTLAILSYYLCHTCHSRHKFRHPNNHHHEK